MHDRSLREHFTAAALTGLLSGVDIREVIASGNKLDGETIAKAAVRMADHAIDALNTPVPQQSITPISSFRPPTATEPGPETRKPVSPSPVTSGDAAPKGVDVTPAPASSPTASVPSEPAGKGENPQSWKRKAAPLSEG